jgi:hypothetical protein
MQSMNGATLLGDRASSSLSKHEGEPSFALCDRLDRTRANSQRQLPTDHDYAVPTREYQADQSSLKSAQTAARSVLRKRQRQQQIQPRRSRPVDTVTPYQGEALIEIEVVSTVIFEREKTLPALKSLRHRICPSGGTSNMDPSWQRLLDPYRTRDLCPLNLCPRPLPDLSLLTHACRHRVCV